MLKNLFRFYAGYDVVLWNKFRIKLQQTNSIVLAKIYKYYYYKIMHMSSSFIPYETKIDSGISFPHGLCGIFVSKGAIIGKDCTIFQQVTIGSNTLDDTKHPGAPKIGDNVFIGAGAKIIGGIVIGDNVRIGANAVVYEDVPDNCSVVNGGGMRVIPHGGHRINRFKTFEEFELGD